MWATGEVVWNSQRDDWSHLYLYDLATGTLKNRITSGAYRVSPIIRLDEKTRTVHFVAMGSEKGRTRTSGTCTGLGSTEQN